MAEFATTAAGVAAGAAGSLANTALGAGLSYGLNAMSTSKAHDRQKNMMTRGPTYIMEGLRAAGINPILAAGSSGFGGSTAKAPQAGSATVSGGNFSQAALLKKEIELKDAQTDATMATGAKALAERDIIASGQSRADYLANLFLTDEGREYLDMQELQKGLPQSMGGTAARTLYRTFNQSRPPTTKIGPAERRSINREAIEMREKSKFKRHRFGPRPSWGR